MSATRATGGAAAVEPTGSTARPSLMSPPDRVGVTALVVIMLGGLWVMAAPFIVGYQDGTHWAAGTIDSFAVGGSVAVLAFAAIIVVVAGMLVELQRTARTAHRTDGAAGAAPDTRD